MKTKRHFPKFSVIKRQAKIDLKKSYYIIIILSFLLTYFMSGSYNPTTKIENSINRVRVIGRQIENQKIIKFADDADKIVDKFQADTNYGPNSKKGLISKIYHAGKANMSVIYYRATSYFYFLMTGHPFNVFVAVLILLIIIAGLYFLIGPIKIAMIRFCLEQNVDGIQKTLWRYVLFVYKSKYFFKYCNMMLKFHIYSMLWMFTVVGYAYKRYSYFQIPYLLAEDPTKSWKEIFAESREIMAERKFKTFKFELSFAPWFLLSLVTFGIVDILFAKPYYEISKARLFEDIVGRDLSLKETKPLNVEEEKFNIQKYNPVDLGLIFFIFSFIGYVTEVTYMYILTNELINRGSLYGPWIPIYGVGGVLMIFLLNRYKPNPIKMFFYAMGILAVTEFMLSILAQYILHKSYWDYNGYFLNIQGRVCLEGTFFFACLGLLCVYVFAPILEKSLLKINIKIRTVVFIILIAGFLVDIIVSIVHPHHGLYISESLK